MKIFLKVIELRLFTKLLLQKVFNCFHIMVGCLLNFLYSKSIFHLEVRKDLIEESMLRFDIFNSLRILGNNLIVEQCFIPLQLHEDSVPHQSKLTEIRSQLIHGFSVPSVKWRNCG